MKKLGFALLILTCWTPAAAAAGLTLAIRDGLVTIDAQDVTVRQILAEWARIGKTQIVNVERIPGGPVTLKLDAVPEKQALDTILRSIPGYVAIPRAGVAADASLYDRILIMPTTTAVAAPRTPQPVAGFPGMQPGMFGAPGGPYVTQLRPTPPTALMPGALPEPPNAGDQMDDPAIAAAAAAGLVTAPALPPGAPGSTAVSAPLALPGAPTQPQPAGSAPGLGAPTNPWNAPVGTPQPSLAPPQPPAQPPPPSRVRPPQADR